MLNATIPLEAPTLPFENSSHGRKALLWEGVYCNNDTETIDAQFVYSCCMLRSRRKN